MKDLNKYRGCLLGGAVGDALGYTVEFFHEEQIFQRFGKQGITEYSLINGVAPVSDDTQMTLFTATGLLVGTTRGMTQGMMGPYSSYLSYAYSDWLKTQLVGHSELSIPHSSWLNNVPEINQQRAPGNTCLSACRKTDIGTIETPINNSKGCGGVMRVAPIGLYFEGKDLSKEEIAFLGAEAAALTHGHELGYLPAAALVHIINLVSHDDSISLAAAVKDSVLTVKKLFTSSKHLSEFEDIMEKAMTLSQANVNDLEAIHELGEGWVAEETLAIAVYCALKYATDFEKAIVAAVNHNGDSDSTGSVTGNILGAYLGLSAIPQKFLDYLELKDVITEIADDLYHDCQMTEYGSYYDKKWVEKYIKHTYRG
ncbi:MAG: ADP-ribosylglycohydrolase family protein [Ruminococcaceae bacterium]|nr:ADP-ribosylglycohydrolase family protein [Oscillospiraceae bacterium]